MVKVTSRRFAKEACGFWPDPSSGRGQALHKDFNRYNNPDKENKAQEETGWKVIHGDVFREPKCPGLLACYVGTGSQTLGLNPHPCPNPRPRPQVPHHRYPAAAATPSLPLRTPWWPCRVVLVAFVFSRFLRNLFQKTLGMPNCLTN